MSIITKSTVESMPKEHRLLQPLPPRLSGFRIGMILTLRSASRVQQLPEHILSCATSFVTQTLHQWEQ